MIDLQEIENTIAELENGKITLNTCNDLANLYIIKDHLKDRDLIPESNMDEDLMDIQSLLVRYMMDRDIITLNIMLSALLKMLSELYHTCETPNEKTEFMDFAENVNKIISK